MLRLRVCHGRSHTKDVRIQKTRKSAVSLHLLEGAPEWNLKNVNINTHANAWGGGVVSRLPRKNCRQLKMLRKGELASPGEKLPHGLSRIRE